MRGRWDYSNSTFLLTQESRQRRETREGLLDFLTSDAQAEPRTSQPFPHFRLSVRKSTQTLQEYKFEKCTFDINTNFYKRL